MKITNQSRITEAKSSLSKSRQNTSENSMLKRSVYYSIKKYKETLDHTNKKCEISMIGQFMKLGKHALLKDKISTCKRQMSLDFDTVSKNRTLQSLATQNETIKTMEYQERSLIDELTKVRNERKKIILKHTEHGYKEA